MPPLWLLFSILALVSNLILINATLTPSPEPASVLLSLTPQETDFSSFDLTNALYTPSNQFTSITGLTTGLPLSCAPPYVKSDTECPTTFTLVQVRYDDCEDPWIMCYCDSASISMSSAIVNLGRIPVGLRRYVSTVLILPGDEPRAYTLTNGDLHMFGDCSMLTWIHEATHSYDYASEEPISGSQQWLDAISADSCAPDIYGSMNQAEDFAQMSVLKIFSLIYNGQLPEGWTSECMSHQLAVFEGLPLYNRSTLFGNTCAIYSDMLAGARKVNGPRFSPVSLPRIFPDPNANTTVTTSGQVPLPTLADPIPSPLPPTSGERVNRVPLLVETWFYALLLSAATRFLLPSY